MSSKECKTQNTASAEMLIHQNLLNKIEHVEHTLEVLKWMARYRLMASAHREISYIWDVQNNTCEYSPEVKSLLGFQSSELSGSRSVWMSLVHPEDRSTFRSHSWTPDNLLYSFEYRMQHEQGTYISVRDSGSCEFDSAGALREVVGTVSDISAEFSFEKQKKNFLTLVSHETKTPISVILNSVDLLRTHSGLSDEKREELLESIQRSAARLRRVSERGILACKLERDSVLRLVRTSVSDLLEEVTFLTETYAAASQIRVISKIEEATLLLDKDKITSALCFVVENAIRHSVPSSKIEILGRVNKDEYFLEVFDAGVRNTEIITLDEWFDVPSIDHHSTGLGIGIGLASEVLRQHKGALSVDRCKEGTRVILKFHLE